MSIARNIVLTSVLLLAVVSCGKRSGGTGSAPANEVYSINILTDNEITFDKKSDCLIVCGNDTLRGRVHCRGGGSSKYYKHSFAVKLDKRYPLTDMPSDKDWILNASFIDKTFLRHKLSFDIYRAMHDDNKAPMCTYAELYVNGDYAGLYVVMQKMDASTLDIDKTSSEAAVFKDPPIFFENHTTPQDSTNYYHQKYPKKRKDDRTWQADALHSLVFDSDDSTFNRTVGQMFDLRNIRDWHILLMLTNNSDGILKNFYIYKSSDSLPFRVAAWDYDHSFGRDGDGEYNMLQNNVDIYRNMLLKRLMRMPEYRQQLSRRWRELRENRVIDYTAIEQRMDADIRTIRAAAAHNATLWPYDEPYFYDGMDFDEETDIMKTFTRLNIERLDHYFANINNKINRKKLK